eukprot:gene3113-3408_t
MTSGKERDWVCEICTLINPALEDDCLACGGSRGSDGFLLPQPSSSSASRGRRRRSRSWSSQRSKTDAIDSMDDEEAYVQDEAHRLKNKSARLVSVLRGLPCRHRLLLTGTPLQNSLPELWALLTFLLPDLFHHEDDLLTWFNRPFESDDEDKNTVAGGGGGSGGGGGGGGGYVSTLLSSEEREVILASLHRLMKPFLLRRVKAEVARDLPRKH